VNTVPAIEIGGTHVTAALVDLAQRRVVAGSRNREPLDANGPAGVILGSVLHCARRLGVSRGATWGAAVPGPFDFAAGVGRYEGVAKLASLNGVDVGRALRAGLPDDSRIVFLNDADAFVIGEWAAGAAMGHDRVVGITLGTGIGSGFLAGGRIVEGGPDVPPGGEVHFLSIDDRPLEDVVSRRAIIARYAALTGARDGEPVPDVREIAALARGGDPDARRAIQEPLQALGRALDPWLGRFGTTAVVIGGAIAGSWDLVEPPFRDGIGSAIAVLRARLPDDAALIGAAQYAAREPAGVGRPRDAAPDVGE
jgi:glucokinase